MGDIVSWAPISFASSVAFDTVILFLTILKLKSNRANTSHLGYLIYRDSLLYFLFTAVTNIIVLSIQSTGPSMDLIKPNAVPFSTLVTATMGSRVFLNLKLFHQRQARANQGLPFPSQLSSAESKQERRPIVAAAAAEQRAPTPPIAVAGYPTSQPYNQPKPRWPLTGYFQPKAG